MKLSDLKPSNLLEKTGSLVGRIEDSIYNYIYNTDRSRNIRTQKAMQTLYENISLRKDIENTKELPIKTIKNYVRSGNYFNIGELVSAVTQEETVEGVENKGVLVEYTWMARASLEGKLPKKNPEIIGEKKRRIVPENQYSDIAKKYFTREIDTIYTPPARSLSR